ncbi:efflux RND transporter periplasmic adaptor subunit [Gemmata obscuriglobus]|nr:efflux RND transporter periplasmic adaptor subunit [Gemmata obscuriglobus]
MNLRRFVSLVVVLTVLGAGGYTAYRTRERWVPHVFPAGPAAKADGHGGHGERKGGADAHAGHDHAGHDHGARDDRVKLSPQAQRNLALDVDQLTPQEYWRTMMVPGIVVDRPGESDRGVTTKVAGVVTAITARPGDTVKAGQPLFSLQLASEFLQGAQADLSKTAKEIEFALAERDRVANLVKQGTTSEAELIKQQNAVSRLNTQLETGRRQLQVFGLTQAQVDEVQKGKIVTEVTVAVPGRSPQPAPAAGAIAEPLYEVQELKVSLGEQVQAGQTLCLLANHQRLFVEGQAFKSEADALAAAAENRTPIRAEFSDEAPGAWAAQGPLTVHHLSNQVDPAARTFAFYLPLDNQSRTFERDGRTYYVWRYRPGQRVRLRLPVEKLVTLAPNGRTELLPFVLPAGAVVREGAEAYLFVQNGDMFIRKPVRVLYEDRREVVVASDGSVSEADFVVRNQAAALNRALKAAAAGAGADPHAGHSHD